MVIDTSAMIAVLSEPDGPVFEAALRTARTLAMSAVSAYEARIVLGGRRAGREIFPASALQRFDQLRRTLQIAVIPFDADQAILAHEAYRRWGKGFHAAALNMADCAAYALSRLRDEPLLFKGGDFAMTDVEPALGAAP